MSNQPPKHAKAPVHPVKDSHAEGAHKPLIDDDVLHVPKGVSRGTFIFLVLLLIFLMVIWLVPGPMFGIAGGSKNPVAARIVLPDGRKFEWKAIDVMVAQRAFMDALGVDFFLGFQLGIDTSKPDPAELTRILVLDRIAQDAGVDITDADLAEHLRGVLDFQRVDTEDFFKAVSARGLNQQAIENTIRSLLRVARFQQLVGFAGAMPDPKKIEEQWHQENVEFAFDYVTLDTASLREEARKDLPDDAALEAWFGKLSDGEKDGFKTAEKRKAELALFRDSETTPATELLAAFPEVPPEGTEPTAPEDLANQYYNRVYPQRFAKPREEGADSTTPSGFFTFDEVEQQCLAEAGVYFALQRWIEDLNARRTNGETLDFAAEAERLGLERHAFLEPLTSEQYVADEALGDEDLASAVFNTPADGSFYASPVPLAQGLSVVRTNERTEPELPPFATIRERVAEKWLEPKAEELASKRLASLREGLERFEPAPKEGQEATPTAKDKKAHHRATAEVFRAAALGAGLEVKQRDYLNKAGPASKDSAADDEERRTLFAQASAFGLYNLEPDELAEPGLSYDKEKAYLVRLAGKRDVSIENMSPTQYDRYKQSTRSRAVFEIGKQLDLAFLRKNYALWLYEDSAEAQAAKMKSAEKSTE